jgi:hypothetical protein
MIKAALLKQRPYRMQQLARKAMSILEKPWSGQETLQPPYFGARSAHISVHLDSSQIIAEVCLAHILLLVW